MEIIAQLATWQKYENEVWQICKIMTTYTTNPILTIVNSNSIILNSNNKEGRSNLITLHLKVPQKLINALTKRKIAPDELGPNACEHINEARAFCAILHAHKNEFPHLGLKAQEITYIAPKV